MLLIRIPNSKCPLCGEISNLIYIKSGCFESELIMCDECYKTKIDSIINLINILVSRGLYLNFVHRTTYSEEVNNFETEVFTDLLTHILSNKKTERVKE